MKDYYYIEVKVTNNDNPVLHRSGCMKLLAIKEKVKFLGTFNSPSDAYTSAGLQYWGMVACQRCCIRKK